MSAFFIAAQNNLQLIEQAEKTFAKRGFEKPTRHKLSCGEMILYPKQMISADNHCHNEHGDLYCIGTLVYKGKSYTSSMQTLLEDLQSNSVSTEELLGEFVVIYDEGYSTHLLTDATGMYKLFTDSKQSYLSTSFMAAAACQPTTWNKLAVGEQILCGFVAAPDTLVNEVKCLYKNETPSWVKRINNEVIVEAIESATPQESAKKQADLLRQYMNNVSALAKDFGSECGLSGGCDSRLIYVSTNEACTPLKSAHTHQTSTVHNKEISAVRNLVELYKTKLNIIPTTFLPDCSNEDIESVLHENVMYYDARNAETIGGMSQTHTRSYKVKTAHGNGLTFSGIAGEIYRDFYYTQMSSFKMRDWLETRIFASRSPQILGKCYKKVVSHIIEKTQNATKLDLKGNVTPLAAKRFFDSYRIPNALANVVHANNQMSFYLAPFCESKMIQNAAPDSAYHDHFGEYEGIIMDLFNPKSTSLPTSKPYGMKDVPENIRRKWYLMSRYPYWVWKLRECLQRPNQRNVNAFRKLQAKSEYFCRAVKFFDATFPEFSLRSAKKGFVSLNSLVFTICALYEISNLNNIE